jgi:hypothetical protein
MNPAVQARTSPTQAVFPAAWAPGRHCTPAPPRPCWDHPAASEGNYRPDDTAATNRPPTVPALIGLDEHRGSADPALPQLRRRKDRM